MTKTTTMPECRCRRNTYRPAFNRHCDVAVEEYIIPDAGAFVPIVLRLDMASLRHDETWLDAELACVTPLRPGVTFERRTLREQPEAARAYSRFYDPKVPMNHANLYRDRVSAVSEEHGAANCQLVVLGGPDVHTIGTFERFALSCGWVDDYADRGRLEFAVLKSQADVSARWEGVLPRDWDFEMEADRAQLERDWTEICGVDKLPVAGAFFAYARGNSGPHRCEPIMAMHPWVLAVTPPGWSVLSDGYTIGPLEGLRGVVATDVYHGINLIFQIQEKGPFRIPKTTPVARLAPAPRSLLKAGYREEAFG